jgi:methionyl-tRNA synthetase
VPAQFLLPGGTGPRQAEKRHGNRLRLENIGMGDNTFYVTTPIYYVNDKPHIGHAYTTILADVLARYHRLMGSPTYFLTGTDEHGQKVQQAADKRGVAPQAHADETVVRFVDLWQRLEITNDDFIRTTEERHKVVVQEILQDLFDRDEIYRADYDGWYCVTCERFLTDKDVVDGTCPGSGCGRPVEKIKESNYFFRMSKYQQWLIDYIHANPAFIQPDFRRNETLGFLRNELTDLCISRPKSRLSWGIELPFDADFVTYVWFDALVNYISAVGYRRDAAAFARWWPVSCHLIGKDILTTHTVYWPTMLQAMGLPQPRTIFAHGWWLVGREKMSKSAGNVVNPMTMAERYGTDPFRYFLMAEMSLGHDASFTEAAFMRRYNTDLANDLGNMLSRVTKLMRTYCGGCIPACGVLGEEETSLREVVLAAAAGMVRAVEEMRIDQGLSGLAGAIREANRYLEKRQPWTLAKQPAEREQLGTVLYCTAEALRIVAGMLDPVMPTKMAELRRVLGCSASLDGAKLLTWGELAAGAALGEACVLFPRLLSSETSPEAETAGAPPVPSQPAPKGVAMIEYGDFAKVKLRTAMILKAEAVPGTDKLLRLQVALGAAEERQIVAGIAKHYRPEALVGRMVVVVANLKPVRIRDIESQGMLLAAGDDIALRLLTVDGDLPPGTEVR